MIYRKIHTLKFLVTLLCCRKNSKVSGWSGTFWSILKFRHHSKPQTQKRTKEKATDRHLRTAVHSPSSTWKLLQVNGGDACLCACYLCVKYTMSWFLLSLDCHNLSVNHWLHCCSKTAQSAWVISISARKATTWHHVRTKRMLVKKEEKKQLQKVGWRSDERSLPDCHRLATDPEEEQRQKATGCHLQI